MARIVVTLTATRGRFPVGRVGQTSARLRPVVGGVLTATELHGRHSFDTGIDPLGTDTHHGVLVVSNHDTIAPRSGFETHPHRNMEIVTWVLDGSLVHQDSEGHTGVIYPNLAQRMTAGTGIRHSEKNDRSAVNPDADRSLDLIQMWVVPDAARGRARVRAVGAGPVRHSGPAGGGGVRDGAAPGPGGDPDPEPARRPACRAARTRRKRHRPGCAVRSCLSR